MKLARTIGHFGQVEVSWQASPREANTDDFTPSAGSVRFIEGQKQAFIDINIIDDDDNEHLQVSCCTSKSYNICVILWLITHI